jgi:hypothetical protein
MVKHVITLLFAVASLVVASPAYAQVYQPGVESLSGPRIGATFLSPAVRDRLDDRGVEVGPLVSQLGWQKEKRFVSTPGGLHGVTEFVLLFGGVDKGLLLPSLSWLVGLRTSDGFEFAAGPNYSAAGMNMVYAAGVNFAAGDLNIPVNIAVVPSKSAGTRVSLLFGFNTRTP